MEDTFITWQETGVEIEEYIFTKCEQNGSYSALKCDHEYNKILIHVDYSENCQYQQQNEIHSRYFRHKSFSVYPYCMRLLQIDRR